MYFIIVLIIVVFLCGGWGYSRSPYYDRWGYQGGIGLGTLLLIILLVCWALGLFGATPFHHFHN